MPTNTATDSNVLRIFLVLISLTLLSCTYGSTVALAQETQLGDPAQLVKDINPATGSSTVDRFYTRGDLAIFANGNQLWRSDGTADGTFVLQEITLAEGSPQLIKGVWYFFASEAKSGFELWRSDGTVNGTQLVKDVRAGAEGSAPAALTVVEDRLFFVADNGINGREIWMSDGTPGNTRLLKDLTPGADASNPTNLASANHRLFFTVNLDLWVSDGSEAGTLILKHLEPRVYLQSNYSQVAAPDRLYFLLGLDLWTSDGTLSGTILLKEFLVTYSPGELGGGHPDVGPDLRGTIGNLVLVNGRGAAGESTILWKSEGTVQSTTPMTWTGDFRIYANFFIHYLQTLGLSQTSTIFAVDSFRVLHGVGYFISAEPVVNVSRIKYTLWRTDGTPAGTKPLQVIGERTLDDYIAQPTPPELLVANNLLLFVATDDEYGKELWRLDGTETGTSLLLDIWPGVLDSLPEKFVAVNGKVLFMADDSTHGRELWISDGTSAGTTLLRDLDPTIGKVGSHPQQLKALDDQRVLFVATEANLPRLWQSDGTSQDTQPIANITLDARTPTYESLWIGENLYVATFNALWKSDKTLSNPQILMTFGNDHPSELQTMNGKLYFLVKQDGFYLNRTKFWSDTNQGLWQSDGTASGTVRVKKNLFPYSKLLLLKDTLYFSAFHHSDSLTGLWKSDGTPEGTVLVKHIESLNGEGHLNALLLIYKEQVIFTSGGEHSVLLWKSDGTITGTTSFANVYAINSWPYGFVSTYTIFDNRLIFAVKGSLYSSDGTPAGLTGLFDQGFLEHWGLAVLNNKLIFSASDANNGVELWKAPNATTSNGIELLRDLNPGTYTSNPQWLFPVGDVLLFSATDGSGPNTLWRTNDSGTRMQEVQKLTNPAEFTKVGSNIFFSANDGVHGQELWTIPITEQVALSLIAPSQVQTALGGATIPLDYRNNGTSKATDLQIAVTLAPGLRYLGDTASVKSSVEGNVVKWNLGDIGFLYRTGFNLQVQTIDAPIGATLPLTITMISNQTPVNEAIQVNVLNRQQVLLPILLK